MMTEFGGAVAVPSAVRSSDSTTTIRVNDVIMIRIEGAIDSTVSSAISWIARSVTPPLPWPRLMLISCASAGPAGDPAAIRAARNKTLRGNRAGLTKGSLGGPAMTPSRLRDSQNRPLAKAKLPGAPSMARCGMARRGSAAARGSPAARPPAGPRGRAARRRLGRHRRRADPWLGDVGRPAKRGFKALRHLGEILVRARQSRRRRRRRRWWRRYGTFRRADRGCLWRFALPRRAGYHRLVARRDARGHRLATQLGAGLWPASQWFRRKTCQGIAAPFRRRRPRAAHFVGKRGPDRAGRRLRHLRLGVVEHV